MTCDRQHRQHGTCSKRIMGSWLAILLSTTLVFSAKQACAQQEDPLTILAGDIDLYLYAEYAAGLTTPRRPPQLMAQAINSKRISCQHKRAATISGAINAASILLESATSNPAAKCVSAYPLQGGLYTLQASYIKGANWATWNCYQNPGAVTTAAAPVAVPLFSSQAVVLQGGSSYTCVATYTALTPDEEAAVESINWDTEMVKIASIPAGATPDASVGPAADCPAITYKQPPRGRPAAPLDVSGSTIINTVTKQPVQLRGINWFGFNVDMGMVDGLWAGGSDATTDFSTIVYELNMLGYNAVRLPFAHNFLAKTNVWDLVRDCTILNSSQMKTRLTRPEDSAAASKKTLPANASPMPKPQCNGYLPTTKNEDRFLFAIQQFVALGMYVILDYQPQGLEQYAYKLDDFVSRWQAIWKKVTCLPNFNSDIANRVLIDVMNEPDSMGIRWEAQGDRPGAEQLYLTTADKLYTMSPNKMLFMFEGTGQNNIGLNWGNGFVTDQSVISSRGLSNPTNFFKQVVFKPYVKKVVFSPHLYPPSITMSTWLGVDLWKQSQLSFAYLMTTGYCSQGRCITFPILIGETGSAYKTDSDKQWLQDFSDFVYNRGNAAQYAKQPASGWLWWAYNENSGDTGGIVQNNWQDLDWNKLRFQMDKLGLTPWYKWPSTTDVGGRRRPRRSTGSAEADAVPTDAVDTPEAADVDVAAAGGTAAAVDTSAAGDALAAADSN